MKNYFQMVVLSICILLLGYSRPVMAAEKVQRAMRIDSFSEIAKEKPIYALIYNTYEYQLKDDPFDGECVATVPSGQQVILLECVFSEGELWFLCEAVVNGVHCQGYVERQFVISGDSQYNEWLDNICGRVGEYTAYASDGENQRGVSSEFASYVEKYFPLEYRQGLLELKQGHPNWNFVAFYTDLDWNTVIENEMVPTRNLIYWTAKDEWKSQAEGDYDPLTGTYIGKSGADWVQASRSAVEYFMNPANFLDEKSIFMFEQLTYDTSAHNQSGVEAILNGTWMYGQVLEDNSWGTYADAFMQIASRTGVSPYHLASRVRQEQGALGSSMLISGTVPEYEGYYNYFNINASGATSEDIVASGLSYARSVGWNTRFAALEGGARIISSNYISKGQDTLYLQKFDVDASYNGLFSHQYMQNVQAPYTESRKVYDAYHAIGNIDNSFVFKIPVYNNMGMYEGNINSELKMLSLNKNAEGGYYFQGEIVVVEWVNGESTVPQKTPVMYFESTDGAEKIDVFVTSVGTNTYYFDRFIGNLTPGREYVFRIESGSDKNISPMKSMTLLLNNSDLPGTAQLGRIGSQVLGYYTDYADRLVIRTEEYHYTGNINSELKGIELRANEAGQTYLAGEIVVVEWVDGISTVPSETPVMKFKSVSGEEIPVFVTPTGTNTYYFDRFIEGLREDENYYFEISSGSQYNVSPNKSMRVRLDTSPDVAANAELGELGGNKLIYEQNDQGELVIRSKSGKYKGDINSQLNSVVVQNMGENNYMSGEIIVVEWVDGVAMVPEETPRMRLVSDDGVEDMEMFVSSMGTNTYYFDRSFGYLRLGMEYRIIVESGSLLNQSENRSMTVAGSEFLPREGLLCEMEGQTVWYRIDDATGQFVVYARNDAY